MRMSITIEYNSGASETYVAAPPEWKLWEQKTGFTISQVQEKLGITDLLFLAYHAHKRESAGTKTLKPFDTWCETVADVIVGDASPKVIEADQSNV